MKILFSALTLLLISQMSFAFSTPEVRVKLIDKNKQPVVGFPVYLQTSVTDVTKLLTPHSNALKASGQVVAVTDANGVAVLKSHSSFSTPREMTFDVGFIKSCAGGIIKHAKVPFMFGNAPTFRIDNDGPRKGFICTLFVSKDDASSEFDQVDIQNLQCSIDLTADEAMAALKTLTADAYNSGCSLEDSF